MIRSQLTHDVIGSAMEVHTALGPGLLESAYQACLCYNLSKNGIAFEKEKPMPVVFDEVHLNCGYRIDILVERELVIEIKSVERFTDVHLAQVLTYMKLGNFRTGLLVNFNVAHLKDGIRRVVNSS